MVLYSVLYCVRNFPTHQPTKQPTSQPHHEHESTTQSLTTWHYLYRTLVRVLLQLSSLPASQPALPSITTIGMAWHGMNMNFLKRIQNEYKMSSPLWRISHHILCYSQQSPYHTYTHSRIFSFTLAGVKGARYAIYNAKRCDVIHLSTL